MSVRPSRTVDLLLALAAWLVVLVLAGGVIAALVVALMGSWMFAFIAALIAAAALVTVAIALDVTNAALYSSPWKR